MHNVLNLNFELPTSGQNLEDCLANLRIAWWRHDNKDKDLSMMPHDWEPKEYNMYKVLGLPAGAEDCLTVFRPEHGNGASGPEVDLSKQAAEQRMDGFKRMRGEGREARHGSTGLMRMVASSIQAGQTSVPSGSSGSGCTTNGATEMRLSLLEEEERALLNADHLQRKRMADALYIQVNELEPQRLALVQKEEERKSREEARADLKEFRDKIVNYKKKLNEGLAKNFGK